MSIEEISYSTMYSSIWEILITTDIAPAIFPPPLIVYMDGKAELFESDDLNQSALGAVAGKMDMTWIYHNKRHKNGSYVTDMINPIDYNIKFFHSNRMEIFDRSTAWNGELSYNAHFLILYHDIVHEFGHYITNYYKWLRSHSDDYPEPHSKSVKILHKHISCNGEFHDEKQNEAWTLNTLGKLWDINPDLVPKPDGRYAQRSTNQLYPDACNLFRYFQAWYRLDYIKLSKAQIKTEQQAIDDVIDYCKRHFDPSEVFKWKL